MIHSLVRCLSRNWDRHPSLLTLCGSPVERSLTTAPGLRLTMEVACARASPEVKWQAITACTGLSPNLLGRWSNFAYQPAQRYGVWLGVREEHKRLRFKIYQEASRPFGNELDDWLEPSMVSADDQGSLEFYGRLRDPTPNRLHQWLTQLDAQAALPLLLDHLGLFADLSREHLAGLRLGASVRMKNGQFQLPTVFIHIHQMHDDNRSALQAIERLTQSLGIEIYGLLSLRKKLLTDPLQRMGMLGLTLGNGEHLTPGIGVAGLPARWLLQPSDGCAHQRAV